MGFFKDIWDKEYAKTEKYLAEEKAKKEKMKDNYKYGKSHAAILKAHTKQQADAEVEAYVAAENETDPIKRMKILNRIEHGIYDISDL